MYSETNVRSNRFSVRTNNIPIKDLGEIRGTVALDLSEASRFRFTVIGNVTFITTNQSVSDDIEFLFVNEGFTITYPSNFNVTNLTNTSYVNIVTRFTKNGGQWTETYYKTNTENPYEPYTPNRINFRTSSITMANSCCLNNLTCFTAACSALSCCAIDTAYRGRNYIRTTNSASYDHCWVVAASAHFNVCSCNGSGSQTFCNFALLLNNQLSDRIVPVAIPCNTELTANPGQTCSFYSVVGVSDAGRLYNVRANDIQNDGGGGGSRDFLISWNYLCCRNPTVPLLGAQVTGVCCICCIAVTEAGGDACWCTTALGFTPCLVNSPFHYFRWMDKCTAAYTFGAGNGGCCGCTGTCAFPRTLWIRDIPNATCVCTAVRIGIPLTKALNCNYYISYVCKVLNCHHWELICDANGGSCNVVSMVNLITNFTCTPCTTSETTPAAIWAGSVITCDACYYLNFYTPVSCDFNGCVWYRCCSTWFPATPAVCLCVQVYCKCTGNGAFCTTANNIAVGCWTDADNWRYVGTRFGFCGSGTPGCVGAYLKNEVNCGYSSNNYIQEIIVVCKCTGGQSIHGVCFSSGGFWTVSTCSYDCLASMFGCTYNCGGAKNNIGWTSLRVSPCMQDTYCCQTYSLFIHDRKDCPDCFPSSLMFLGIKNVCCSINSSLDCCTLSPNMNPVRNNLSYSLQSPSVTRYLNTGKPYGLQCNE